MKTKLGLIVVTGLVLVGCTSHKANQPTAAQVAAKLSGLGCSPFKPSGRSITLGIKPIAVLDCTINGESITVEQWANHDQVQSAFQEAKGLCPTMKSYGVTSVSGVSGSNWSVGTLTRATAVQVQLAEGGTSTVETMSC
jgi:hypothetical protein